MRIIAFVLLVGIFFIVTLINAQQKERVDCDQAIFELKKDEKEIRAELKKLYSKKNLNGEDKKNIEMKEFTLWHTINVTRRLEIIKRGKAGFEDTSKDMPLVDYNDRIFRDHINVLEFLWSLDNPNVKNESTSKCGGDADNVIKALQGKISPDEVDCKDAVAYLLHKVGHKCGRYTASQLGHIAYIAKCRKKNGSIVFVVVDYNVFKVTESKENESLMDFIFRTRKKGTVIMKVA